MIVTCHQPHFLPWIPYLNRVARADVFLLLDDVGFRKSYFQNRALIANSMYHVSWVTVPVRRARLGTPICGVEVCSPCPALTKSTNRLRETYGRYNNDFLVEVLAVLAHPPRYLLELNMRLLQMMLDYLDIDGPEFIPISKVVARGQHHDRLLEALRALRATRVIIGMGGMARANNLAHWAQSGITLSFQTRQNVFAESSLGIKDGVSALHDIVIHGAARTAAMVTEFWKPDAT